MMSEMQFHSIYYVKARSASKMQHTIIINKNFSFLYILNYHSKLMQKKQVKKQKLVLK